MLRQAADSNPADSRLPLTLAQYETLYGSRARAVQTREDLHRRLQPIPENVSGLYSLLYMPPSFDAIIDTDGKPMLATRWNQLNGEQRGRFLSDTSRAMQTRAEEVYKAALTANPLDIGLAVQKARVMREQGNIDEGTRAIQGVIDAAKARGKVPAGMYLDLGIHLLGGNRVAAADAAFAEARKLQDPKKREADLTLVEIEVQRGRIKEAAAALEDYAKSNPRVEVWARLSELLLGDSQYDQAQAALDKAKAMAGTTPSIPYQTSFEMLAAGIAAGRAEAADRAGNLPEGKRLREVAAAGLLKAEALQPNSLTPPLRRIGVLRAAAKAGGRLDPELYALAVAEADKLVARNAAIYEAAALRANLSIDHGDKLGAIGVLERFLVAQPLDDAARARLIQLHMETGNLAKAVAVCRAASELAPSRADWRERLGDLLSLSGDSTGAGDAYERAFLVQPEIFMLLAKSMDERTRAGKPELALTMQQNAGPNAQSDPAVRAAQAAALMKQNKSAEAQAVAREAITTARAAGIHSPAMQQVLPRLRAMYPPDRTQELVDLIVSTGAPNAAEKVLIASMWGDLGKANGDLVLKWADDALSEGESVPAGLRATALTARGNALYIKGDIPGAIKAFQAAADLEPRNGTALNNAAYIAAEAGVDLDRSRTYAERAVAIAPETGEFLDTLGYVLTIQGTKAQDAKLLEFAEGVLQRALLMTESPVVLLHLGDVQAALTRTLDARKSYERAMKAAESAKNKDAELIKKIDDAMKALK
jgi:tetratricopeptide (TPR) repeat protein